MYLSDEQRAAVRLQWWILGGGIGLMLLAFLGSKLWFDEGFPGGSWVPAVCLLGGLTNLSIGYLSIRYEVSILGKRLDFWRPIEGGYAKLHGYGAVFGGLMLLGLLVYMLISWLPAGQALWYILGGLFVLAMLVLIMVGLRRAFKQD